MNRTEKVEELERLKGIFASRALVVVCRSSGMTVAETSELRRACGREGAQYRVSKNTLLRMAVDGNAYEALGDEFKGPVSIAWSRDPVAAARVTVKFAKTNDKLEVVKGAGPDAVLDREELVRLAELPSMDELRAGIVGLLLAPAGRLVRTVCEPSRSLARLIAIKPENNK